MQLLIAEQSKFVKDLPRVYSLSLSLELLDGRLQVFLDDFVRGRRTSFGKMMSLAQSVITVKIGFVDLLIWPSTQAN